MDIETYQTSVIDDTIDLSDGDDLVLIAYIASSSLGSFPTHVLANGVPLLFLGGISEADRSISAWGLKDPPTGLVTVTYSGGHEEIYLIAYERVHSDPPDWIIIGQFGVVVTISSFFTSPEMQVASGHLYTFLVRSDDSPPWDPGDTLSISTRATAPGALMGDRMGSGDGGEQFSTSASGSGDREGAFLVVAFTSPPEQAFTPSPCASMYVEADLIPFLSEGEVTSPYPIPDYGTAGTEPWGGGDAPDRPEAFLQGFYFHETGAPGTDGPWIEDYPDHEVEGFPGHFHRRLIQPPYDLPEDQIETLSEVLGISDPIEAHWTCFSVMKVISQPERHGGGTITGNVGDERGDLNEYDFTREWFGTSGSWGFGHYTRFGQHFIALHVGYDNSQYLELPVGDDEWFYLEARQDATAYYLRINDTEVIAPVPAGAAADMNGDGNNSIQWGDWDHHAGWTLLQFCSTTLHCPSRQVRRWEIQDKYGLPRSPEEDCASDPEPIVITSSSRRSRMVQIIG